MIRIASVWFLLACAVTVLADEVESRRLTHYLPQDFLETMVRKEDWSPLNLTVEGGLKKGDTVRIWAGGSIDRGNGDQPGQNVAGPEGAPLGKGGTLALAQEPTLAYALLFKTESNGPRKYLQPGKALEIPIAKDGEKVWIGFNDEKGRYHDNHIGKGQRQETDPLWVRVEVVRIIID